MWWSVIKQNQCNLFIVTVACFFFTVIEEGNWLALHDAAIDVPPQGFDAVICLGNSFAHLPDFQGDLSNQKLAIQNFKEMLKPGGVLFIDHRNYDAILDSGKAPQRNLYYNVSVSWQTFTVIVIIHLKTYSILTG